MVGVIDLIIKSSVATKGDHSNEFIIRGQNLLRLESVKYAGGL
jgi:hypothetical protein